jgi:hypothetical protein
MSFAIMVEAMTIIAFVTIIVGGKQKRETGWKLLSFLLLLVSIIQCAGMTLVVSFFLLCIYT